MTIAVVQAVGVSGDGASVASVTTPDITTTSANLVILNAQTLTFVSAFGTVTDNKSNDFSTESLSLDYGGSTFPHYTERYNANISGGSGHNFTLTTGIAGSGYPVLAATEISGHAASPLDKISVTSNIESTTHTTPDTATTSQANELLHGCGADDFSTVGAVHSVSSPWSPASVNIDEVAASGTPGIITADRVVSSAAAYNFTYTTDTTLNNYMSSISTWKAAAVGGAFPWPQYAAMMAA